MGTSRGQSQIRLASERMRTAYSAGCLAVLLAWQLCAAEPPAKDEITEQLSLIMGANGARAASAQDDHRLLGADDTLSGTKDELMKELDTIVSAGAQHLERLKQINKVQANEDADLGEGNNYYDSNNAANSEEIEPWEEREKKDFWGQPFELSP